MSTHKKISQTTLLALFFIIPVITAATFPVKSTRAGTLGTLSNVKNEKTQAQFLASLKGDKGATGEKGDDGDTYTPEYDDSTGEIKWLSTKTNNYISNKINFRGIVNTQTVTGFNQGANTELPAVGSGTGPSWANTLP